MFKWLKTIKIRNIEVRLLNKSAHRAEELAMTNKTGVKYPVVMDALNKEIAKLEAELAQLKAE